MQNLEKNNKILIYPGSLRVNGITTSLIETVTLLLNEGFEVVIWNNKDIIEHENLENFKKIFIKYKNISYINTSSLRTGNLITKLSLWLFTNKRFSLLSIIFNKFLEKFFEEEAINFFNNRQFNKFVNFSGYESIVSGIARYINSSTKIIYIHNNMISEFKTRKNFAKYSVFRLYGNYNNAVFVSDYLKKYMTDKLRVFRNSNIKLWVIPNLIKTRSTIERLKNDYSSITRKNLESLKIIKNTNQTKIASIGRESIEKNHLLAIKVFVHYYKKIDSNSIFILVTTTSGFKKKKNTYYNFKMWLYLRKKIVKNNSIIIKDISNIFPILFNIDILLALSLYEGQGLVPIESAQTGTATVASAIPTFVEQNTKYGNLTIINTNKIDIISRKIQENLNSKSSFPTDMYIKKTKFILNELYLSSSDE